MEKPHLDNKITLKEFTDHYWLKKELTNYCRQIGINSTGGKLEIVSRIEVYLKTGDIVTKSASIKDKITSKFNWATEKLTIDTVITDSYKNGENVRLFFKESIGDRFKFNVEFMNWMKQATGKTLGDSVDKWHEIIKMKNDKNYKTVIAPQFEYNTYIRAFLDDNPTLKTKDAIASWMIKRDKPGKKIYSSEDLKFINK